MKNLCVYMTDGSCPGSGVRKDKQDAYQKKKPGFRSLAYGKSIVMIYNGRQDYIHNSIA
jgi:hypothetical protein